MSKDFVSSSFPTQWIVLAGILLAGLFMSISTGMFAYDANGSLGFPLDDPWIHLQFARNLHDYGSFSYFKDEMVTSGSTSPLYTILLAVGFFVTDNEMMLSYVLGVLFFLTAGYFLFRLSLRVFDGSLLFACGAVLLMLFEPRLQWGALSGMETTLFILLLVATAYVYESRKPIALGICSGLLLWTRPEALIFLGVLAFDGVYNGRVVRIPKKGAAQANISPLRWMKSSLVIFIGFVALYGGFNLLLSGSILPNTFAAKIKYYSSGNTEFPKAVYHFLRDGHFSILSLFVGIGIIAFLSKLLRRERAYLFLLLWPLMLFFAYWKSLPYLYQEGRYMMPVLPFVIVLGLMGVKSGIEVAAKIIKSLHKPRTALVVGSIVLTVLVSQSASASWQNRTTYAEYCKYITDRQVRTALWLNENLPPDAIVGTHDIGAIAFYSHRRIADMVGLVSPEMIDKIGSFDKLKSFLVSKNVTHLAVLRNWFQIENQSPLFQTDELNPEIMEVFAFDQNRTHFTSQQASQMTALAAKYLAAGNLQQAGPLLVQSVRIDPQASRTHFYLGRATMMAGNLEEAEGELNAALRLHPDLHDAQLALAEIAMKRNQPRDAIIRLENVVQSNPSYAPGYAALAQLYTTFHLDSMKADGYARRYRELAGRSAR